MSTWHATTWSAIGMRQCNPLTWRDAGHHNLQGHHEQAAVRLWASCSAATNLELKTISGGDELIVKRKRDVTHLHEERKGFSRDTGAGGKESWCANTTLLQACSLVQSKGLLYRSARPAHSHP